MRCNRKNHHGFTLTQLVVVMAVVAALALASIGVLHSAVGARGTAKRAQCDVHLKDIVMALDTFRQENGVSPSSLSELVTKKYISSQTLLCPADPDSASHSGQPTYTSYEDYYLIRDPRDSGELPVVVCPFHDGNGGTGEQGYKGGYSTQYSTRPATLASSDYAGVVTITRVGVGVLSLPKAGGKPMELRGGDHIKTGSGTARIVFADQSEANINANTEISVLESYNEGQKNGPLYSLVRQFTGRVNYYVNPGSFFDVATPTATAGALGTRFTLEILAANPALGGKPDTLLTVTEHTVAFSSASRTILVKDSQPAVEASTIKNFPEKPRGKSNGSFNLAAPAPTATPVPTATPTPVPTATPTPRPTATPTPTPHPTATPTPTPQPTATPTPRPSPTPTPTPHGGIDINIGGVGVHVG